MVIILFIPITSVANSFLTLSQYLFFTLHLSWPYYQFRCLLQFTTSIYVFLSYLRLWFDLGLFVNFHLPPVYLWKIWLLHTSPLRSACLYRKWSLLLFAESLWIHVCHLLGWQVTCIHLMMIPGYGKAWWVTNSNGDSESPWKIPVLIFLAFIFSQSFNFVSFVLRVFIVAVFECVMSASRWYIFNTFCIHQEWEIYQRPSSNKPIAKFLNFVFSWLISVRQKAARLLYTLESFLHIQFVDVDQNYNFYSNIWFDNIRVSNSYITEKHVIGR